MNLMDAVAKIGDDIARSQMFSCKNEAQGRVIALSCLTTGRDILSVPEEYYLMNNKLTLQASAMLGRLVKCGGEYQVNEHSPNRCAITIQYKGRKYEGEITWEDAKQEPFVYAGKQAEVLELLSGPAEGHSKLRLSGNYATPRRRMQHLWARVVSDSVRVIAPDLVSGSYTPEEVADFSGIVSKESSDILTIRDFGNATLSPGEFRQLSDKKNETTTEIPSPGSPYPTAMAVESQLENVSYLVKQLSIPQDALAKIYEKRGVVSAADMTQLQAGEFIEFLRQKLEEKQAALNAAKQSAPTTADDSSSTHEPITQVRLEGPVTPDLEARVRDKIKEVAQSNGQGKEFTDKIKLKLDASGMKLKDLTYRDADKLLACLTNMQIEEFFLHVLTIPDKEPVLHPDPGSEVDSESGNESGDSQS
jgi:hypothetical protein